LPASELDKEAKDLAQELGMKFRRTESGNAHPLFIEARYDFGGGEAAEPAKPA
jgi:protoheme ferro-lyase